MTGNFGTSVQSGTAVSTMVAENLPYTLALATTSVGLAIILALIVAYLATVPGLGFIGTFFRSLPSLLVSLPGFWLAILLLQFFSFRLGWVSAINPGPIEGLILPTLTLVVPMAAPLIQVLIRSIDEVNQLSFVQVWCAPGCLGGVDFLAQCAQCHFAGADHGRLALWRARGRRRGDRNRLWPRGPGQYDRAGGVQP